MSTYAVQCDWLSQKNYGLQVFTAVRITLGKNILQYVTGYPCYIVLEFIYLQNDLLTDCSGTAFGLLETAWKVLFDPPHVACIFATKKHLLPEGQLF